MMRTRMFGVGAILTVCGLGITAQAAVIEQAAGTDFLVMEAEAYDSIEGDEFTDWLEVEKGGDLETFWGSQVLPEDSNVSGTAMFDQEGGSNLAGLLNYKLKFATPGIYTVYLHYTMFQMTGDENYANEDSFFLPLEMGDFAEQDGWFSLPKLGNDDPNTEFWEGNFHWNEGPLSYNVSGDPIEYEIGEGDVGTVFDFQVATRERGSTLDAIIFSLEPDLIGEDLDDILNSGVPPTLTGDFNNNGALDVGDIDALVTESAAMTNNPGFDLNADGAVNGSDVSIWAKDLANTWIGDANLDGEFNSSDFVAVFTAGKFETNAAANWSEGDWNGDGVFSSGDFVAAFTDGGFEIGPRPQASANVPEPTSFLIGLSGMIMAAAVSRRRR